jgi:hypothetical protein
MSDFSCNTTLLIASILPFSKRQHHLSSVTGGARNQFGSGKPFGVRQSTAPAGVRQYPRFPSQIVAGDGNLAVPIWIVEKPGKLEEFG